MMCKIHSLYENSDINSQAPPSDQSGYQVILPMSILMSIEPNLLSSQYKYITLIEQHGPCRTILWLSLLSNYKYVFMCVYL